MAHPNAFEILTEEFQGPLDKLLELIEKKQLDITSFNLQKVTGDFLLYLEKVNQAASSDHASARRLIADFLSIASALLLLKSKALLPSVTDPTDTEEEDSLDLTARLELYKRIKTASRLLLTVWTDNNRAFSRELLKNRPVVFYPPHHLTATNLPKYLARLKAAASRQTEVVKMETVRLISVQEKIQEILDIIKQSSSDRLSFKQILNSKNRSETIALFLALLHLIRDHALSAEQPNPLDDVIIKPV